MFALQKAVWWLLQPSNLALLALTLGLALLLLRRPRAGTAWAALALLALLLPSLLPLTAWLAAPLENRFETPTPDRVDGVVVLGGAVSPGLTAARGLPALTDGAERMTEFVALALRYPEAELLFSGGSSALLGSPLTEAEVARRLFVSLGLEGRVRYEDASRDTAENARLSFQLAQPQPGERWLLVTSALHLPRAVLSFEAVGWDVIPYPVDYLTRGDGRLRVDPDLIANLADFDRVVGEWSSLIAFRLLGRTERLLP
jgi:uncharacterized SAM-binding protein YcdF (DUF218 family)